MSPLRMLVGCVPLAIAIAFAAPALSYACDGRQETSGVNHVRDSSSGGHFITGTSGDDVIVGSDANDIIKSYDGNDLICAGPGRDGINGGAKGDTIHGGNGTDFIVGGHGNDTITGDDNDDGILGGPGDDTLHGNAGQDYLRGSTEKDSLYGGTENDYLHAGSDTPDGVTNGGDGSDDTCIGSDTRTGCETRDEGCPPRAFAWWMGVWKYSRFTLTANPHCYQVTGRVVFEPSSSETGDGDLHIALERADGRLIIVEYLPRDRGYYSRPQVGDTLTVVGEHIATDGHGSEEVHPVFKVKRNDGPWVTSGPEHGGNPPGERSVGPDDFCWRPDGSGCTGWNGEDMG